MKQITTLLFLVLCCIAGCSETPPYYVTDKGRPIPTSKGSGIKRSPCHLKGDVGTEVLRSVEELSKTKPKIVAAVRGILDWMSVDEEYCSRAWIFLGDFDAVWKTIETGVDIKFLIRNKDVSLPIIFERFYREGEANSQCMLVYCVVFGKTLSIDALSYLADYIDSVPDNDRTCYLGGYHPFPFASRAVDMITNSEVSILPQKGEEDKNPYWFFDARHKFADAIRRWHKEHSHDSSPP